MSRGFPVRKILLPISLRNSIFVLAARGRPVPLNRAIFSMTRIITLLFAIIWRDLEISVMGSLKVIENGTIP